MRKGRRIRKKKLSSFPQPLSVFVRSPYPDGRGLTDWLFTKFLSNSNLILNFSSSSFFPPKTCRRHLFSLAQAAYSKKLTIDSGFSPLKSSLVLVAGRNSDYCCCCCISLGKEQVGPLSFFLPFS